MTGGEPSSHGGTPGADPTAVSSRVSEVVLSSLSLDECRKQQLGWVTDVQDTCHVLLREPRRVLAGSRHERSRPFIGITQGPFHLAPLPS